jgi:hypothetical protein
MLQREGMVDIQGALPEWHTLYPVPVSKWPFAKRYGKFTTWKNVRVYKVQNLPLISCQSLGHLLDDGGGVPKKLITAKFHSK